MSSGNSYSSMTHYYNKEPTQTRKKTSKKSRRKCSGANGSVMHRILPNPKPLYNKPSDTTAVHISPCGLNTVSLPCLMQRQQTSQIRAYFWNVLHSATPLTKRLNFCHIVFYGVKNAVLIQLWRSAAQSPTGTRISSQQNPLTGRMMYSRKAKLQLWKDFFSWSYLFK